MSASGLQKFWQLIEDTNFAEIYFPGSAIVPDDMYKFAESREKPRLKVAWATFDQPKPNIAGGLSGTLALDGRAWSALKDLLSGLAHVQETVGNQFYLVTPTIVYDALDEVRSAGKRLDSGMWLSLDRAVLRSCDIGTASLFRVAHRGGNRHEVVCNNEMRERCLTERLTGLQFRECELI